MRPVATLCALFANRNLKAGAEPYTARDFMQTFELLPFDTALPDLTENFTEFAGRHNASLASKPDQ